MKYSVLGRTGLKVSKVGFGEGGIAQEWGPTTNKKSVDAVRRALELGINFFDVCYCYGEGKAEEILGVALEGHRDKAIIGTKVDLF